MGLQAKELLQFIGQHGYGLIFGIVLAEAVGLPVPAALAILTAGAASALHILYPDRALATAIAALLTGDLILYVLGRYSGWWLLALLCRFAVNPETCILRSAETFYKRGRIAVLFAKFVPGVNTMASPLAGSMKMPFFTWLRLDFAAAIMYTLTYGLTGYIFGESFNKLLNGFHAMGAVMEWIVGAAIAGYVGYRIWLAWKNRIYRVVPQVSVEALQARMMDDENYLIADVRSHGYYDSGAKRIRGSIRIEPGNIKETMHELPTDKDIYLYCT